MDYLRQLEARSGFDRIRFVNRSGESYTSDGKIADVADRDYFIRGIAGATGRTVVMESRFNRARLIGFFAPVYYRDELCGVMVGFLDQNTVANVLSTDLYGCPADTYVMDGEGTTLGSSVRSGRTEAQSLADLADKLAEGQESRVWAALAEGERTRFSYEGDQGQSFGYPVLWLCGAHRRHGLVGAPAGPLSGPVDHREPGEPGRALCPAAAGGRGDLVCRAAGVHYQA